MYKTWLPFYPHAKKGMGDYGLARAPSRIDVRPSICSKFIHIGVAWGIGCGCSIFTWVLLPCVVLEVWNKFIVKE